MSQTREVQGGGSTLPLMLRAALPAIPGVAGLPGVRRTAAELPDLTLTRHDVAVDRDQLARYGEVCGFRLREQLPLTYPHILAFGLHLQLMTDPSFPFPAIGTVHLQNTITAHRAIGAGERLQITVRAENLRGHAKGRLFDLATTVHSAGEPVWEEVSTFLRRGGSQEPAAAEPTFPEVTPGATRWQLPADLGRRYAAVSGDHNPIHLYGLTAKAFGFPRQIAHGMWSMARCVAALEGRLPDAVTVAVAFKKPILLPGTVAFGSRRLDETPGQDGYAFALTSPRSGAPHLLGRAG